jgi:ketopantoate reductase
MQSLGLKAAYVERHIFGQHELEKVCWLVTHGLLCAVHKVTVGEVAEHHHQALLALTTELVAVAAVERGGGHDPASIVERLRAYSRTIPSFCASVKEWEWRDGWFVEAGAKHGICTPTHHELLRRAGLNDRLPV